MRELWRSPERKAWTPMDRGLAPRHKQEGWTRLNTLGGWWQQPPRGAPLLICDACQFDAAGDYLSRASAFSNSPNTDNGLLSFWYRATAFDGTFGDTILENNNVGVISHAQGTNVMRITNQPTDYIMDTSSGASTATWYNILASWDFTGSSVLHLYRNDTDVLSVIQAHDGGAVDYSAVTAWKVARLGADSSFSFDGAIAEFYFAPNQFIDLSVVSNRRKFISASGKPVNLGTDGSAPTGSVPLFYLHLDDGETVNNFATNRAGNGDFSVNGTLSTAATSPSD